MKERGSSEDIFRAALSAVSETLRVDPFENSEERTTLKKGRLQRGAEAGESDDEEIEIERENESSEKSTMDTAGISKLAMYCKRKEEQEVEMTQLFKAYAQRREEDEKMMKDPWGQIRQLAETTLRQEKEIRDLQLSLEQSRNANMVLQLEIERWKAQAESLQNGEEKGRQRSSQIHDLESQLTDRQEECNQLRIQRDGLQEALKNLREAFENETHASQNIKVEKEQLEVDLDRWRKASQSKAREFGVEVQSLSKEVRGLREFKLEASEKMHVLKRELEHATKTKLLLEKQRIELNDVVEELRKKLELATRELDERTESELKLKLGIDQVDLDKRSLQKRNEVLSQQVESLQEKVETIERARVEFYREQEQKLNETLARMEVLKQKEQQWKSKLERAESSIERMKCEMEQNETEANERIHNLESTLNGVLKNMETISLKNQIQKSTASKLPSPNQANHSSQALSFTTGLDPVGEGGLEGDINVLTDRANKLRMEIEAAAKGAFLRFDMEEHGATTGEEIFGSSPTGKGFRRIRNDSSNTRTGRNSKLTPKKKKSPYTLPNLKRTEGRES